MAPALVKRSGAIAKYKPLNESWRNKIIADSLARREANAAWYHFSALMVLDSMPRAVEAKNPIVVIPEGLHELTSLLCWWCDAAKTGIDPERLNDFYNAARSVSHITASREADGIRFSIPGALRSYQEYTHAFIAAKYTVVRINNFDGESDDPPEWVDQIVAKVVAATRGTSKAVGRPVNPAVGERRKEVRKMERRGKKPGEIAAALSSKFPGITPDIVSADLKR